MGYKITKIQGGRRPIPQRGDTLIITLIVLVLLLLGFIYSSRNILSDTIMSGNNVARQRNAQVSDMALRQIEKTIISASNSLPLESPNVNTGNWFVNKLPTIWTQTNTSWSNCSSGTTPTCGTITGLTLAGNSVTNYTAYYTVQPLNKQTNDGCVVSGGLFYGIYYAIYMYIVENGSNVASTNESILKLCVQGGT